MVLEKLACLTIKDDDKEEKFSSLPDLQEGEILTQQGVEPEQHFTQPPAHYTDATLIRAMEEQGIGRPSTYAPTVSTILDRRYVKKEGKYLVITNLGKAVTAWMKRYFPDIEDLKFTAGMEQQLDGVETGSVGWKDILRDFYYDGFEDSLKAAAEGERQPVEPTVSEEICPICGKNLVERDGKFGPFLACPGFPDCSFTMPLVEVMPGRCPKCGGRLMKRTGTSKKSNRTMACTMPEMGERPPFLTFAAVLAIAPVAGIPPNTPEQTFPSPCAISSVMEL